MKKIILIFILFASALYSQYLSVPQIIQEQDQWCWAGTSSCILNYYGKNINQCTIAEYTRTVATWHNFGNVNCCVDPNQGCNYWNYNWGVSGSIQDILQHWGISNNCVSNYLSVPEVQTELAAQRPFIIRWGWTSGGGHFIVGHGFESATNQMYYMDPWFNEGFHIADYSWVVNNSIHNWTHTNEMSTDPVTPSVPVLKNPPTGSTNLRQPIIFKWSKCDRAIKYRIMIALDSNFFNVVLSDSSLTDTLKSVNTLTSLKKHFWKVKAKYYYMSSDYSTISSFKLDLSNPVVDPPVLPDGFRIVKNYPNPFNGTNVIKYQVKEPSYVTIKIFDISGRECKTVYDGNCNPGVFEAQTSFSDLASGIYFYIMQVNDLKTNRILYKENLKIVYTK